MSNHVSRDLVKPLFHPSDVSFAISWSNLAPGWGHWRVVLDQPDRAAFVSVIPPGMEAPVFFVFRRAGTVVMERQPPGGERREIGQFRGLREALLLLCPLSDDMLEEIHLGLERDFPRDRDGE